MTDITIQPSSPIIDIHSLNFEGEDILYVEHDGKKLYPVPKVGEMYGYNSHDSLQAFKRNLKFIEGNYYRLKLNLYQRTVSVPCLTGEGVLIYTARLGLDKITEDRQIKVIRTVQFMAKTAIGVIEGTPVSRLSYNEYLDERSHVKKCRTMMTDALKENEVPKHPEIPTGVIYGREEKAVNEDVVGIHVPHMSDKLNTTGLRIKSEDYTIRATLVKVGVEFVDRCPVVKDMLDRLYPSRKSDKILLTSEEKGRISRKCPVSQTGLADFNTIQEVS